MKDLTRQYSNGEVTVVWKPSVCIHSGICFRGMPDVFDPRRRPWVDLEAGETQAIVEQVKSCPSGALSYVMDSETAAPPPPAPAPEPVERMVQVAPNGPLIVPWALTVKLPDGRIDKRSAAGTAFCRCGHSGNKPYCDGSHNKAGFTG